MSGVGVFVSLSSCRSFLGVSKLQLPPSVFPPSAPPLPTLAPPSPPTAQRSADALCWLAIVPESHCKTSSNACTWQSSSKSSLGFLPWHPQPLLCFLALSDLGVKGAPKRSHPFPKTSSFCLWSSSVFWLVGMNSSSPSCCILLLEAFPLPGEAGQEMWIHLWWCSSHFPLPFLCFLPHSCEHVRVLSCLC